MVVPSEFILYTNKFFVDTHFNTEYIFTGFEVLLVEYLHGGRVLHVTKYIFFYRNAPYSFGYISKHRSIDPNIVGQPNWIKATT